MKKDRDKTKAELMQELKNMRQQLIDSGVSETEHEQDDNTQSLPEEYIRLFELFPLGTTILDMKGRIIYCNSALYTIGGYTRDEMVGRHFTKIVALHSKDIPGFIRIFSSMLTGKIPKPFETAYQRKDGTTGYTELTVSMINIDRKRYILAIQRDITERKQIEEELKESEKRFRIASQMASDVVYERDLQTGIATFYGDIDSHLGYEPGGYPRNMEGWREHVHPEDLAWIDGLSIDQISTDVPYGIEYRMRKKDGTYMTWWDRVTLIKDTKTGKPVKWIGAATDITERKKAEERHQTILRTTIDGFWTVDLEGKFLEVNDAYCQMLGYTREELLGMSIKDVEAIESQGDIRARIQKIIEQGSDRFETRHKRKDGQVIDVEVSTNYLDIEGGQLPVFVRDITERKKAGEALKRSEEKYRSVVEVVPDGIVTIDTSGVITSMNKAVTDITGFSEGEIVGKHISKVPVISLKSVSDAVKVFGNIIKGKGPAVIEMPCRKRDGTPRIGEFRANLMKTAGKVTGIQVMARDVTERNKAEEALKESEEKFSKAFRSSPDRVVISSLKDGKFIDVNDSYLKFTGYTREEVIGKSVVKPGHWVNPEQRRRIVETLKEGGEVSSEEVQLYIKSGEIRTSLFSAELIDIGGEPCMISVATDITERKRAEEALRESEEFSTSLLNNSPIPTLVISPDTSIRYVNPAFEKLTGFSSEETLGRKTPYPWWTKETLGKTSSDLKQAMQHGLVGTGELFQKKDGGRFQVEITSTPVMKDGELSFYLANWVDVTERKRAEEALKESEEKFRTLYETMAQGVLYQTSNGEVISMNQAAEQILGLTLEQIKNPEIINVNLIAIHEDGTPYPAEEHPTMVSLKTGKPIKDSIMGIYNRQEKGYRWININSVPQFKPGEDKPYQVFVTFSDITERKRAEQALADEATRRRILVEQSRDGIVILDREGRVYESNQRFADMLGYTIEEVRQLNVFDWEYLYPRERVLEMIRTVDEAGDHFETQHVRKDGSTYDVEISTNGATFAGQKLIFCVCRDITERKKAEAALRESHNYLQRLTDSMGDAVFSVKMPERVIEWANDSFKLIGYEPEECVGRTTEFLYPDKDEFLKFGRKLTKTIKAGKDIMHTEQLLKKKDGEVFPAEVTATVLKEGTEIAGITSIIRDISKRKQQERHREFSQRLLEIANLGQELVPTLQQFVQVLKNYSGCAAVGIRILDSEGNIPYKAYTGFGRDFYESESPLSINSDECMCINVIKGDTDPDLPFYTQNGSFYMNGTTAFLASVSAEEKGATRNVCNEFGYESVALVPIRMGNDLLGLIHIADTKTDMVPLDLVNRLEEISPQLGLAIRRLQTEHELAEEKERLEVTLRSTGDGIIAVDTDGVVVLLNRAAEEMTGWTQKEAAGRAIREVFNIIEERNQKPASDPVESVIKTGSIIGLANHAVLKSRDGTERLIADSGAPIHDEQGRVFGVVLVFRDITESQKLQEEQARVAKLESVGTLAGGIAHDFNNLLTGIMGNIGLAKRHIKPEDKAFERLEEAEKASVRARDLTQQLLTFARGGMPIKTLVSLTELIKESATFALRGSNVRLELSLPDGLWVVEVDEGQINQVIHNIVINADEAMPSGGKLYINAQNLVIKRMGALPLPKGNYLEIDIKDEGIGMSKEQLAKIFEPYYTTKQKGSGLGLSTAYSIIKSHSGYIYAESTQNAGTTFHLYLPASEKRATEREEVREEMRSTGKGKILIMDDEEIIRDMLADMLPISGYEVELTGNGEEAITMYADAKDSGRPFDAVIMDLTIPGGMGGKEAIKKLLEIDPGARVIVSSGYSTDPIMSEYKKYGYSAVITKPYSVSQMENTLRDILKRKK